MSASSSNNRRNPWRSRTWSCASKQRILVPRKITSFESVRGGTQFSFVWPESLQNDADDWAEPELHKNMNVSYCSNHLHSRAYEIRRGSAFSCDLGKCGSLISPPGKLQTDAASGKIEHLCCATSLPENLTAKLWLPSSRACPRGSKWTRHSSTANSGAVSKATAAADV